MEREDTSPWLGFRLAAGEVCGSGVVIDGVLGLPEAGEEVDGVRLVMVISTA
jgi:hypothetical protein